MIFKFYFKPIYSTFNGKRTESVRAYELWINGEKATSAKMGETKQLELPERKNEVLVKMSALPHYFPFWIRVLDKLPRAKSHHIEIESRKNKESMQYYVCKSKGTSFSFALKRLGKYICRAICFKAGPSIFSLERVDKASFLEEKKENKPKYSENLYPKPQSKKEKRLILGELALSLALIGFGVFVFNKASNLASIFGMVFLITGSGPILKLIWYWSKSILVRSPKNLRFRCLLNSTVLGIIAFSSQNHPPIFTFSILLSFLYLFFFFYSRRILA